MKTYSKMFILGAVSICSILLGLILLIVAAVTKIIVLICAGVILLLSSLITVVLYEHVKKQSQNENIRSIIPSNEFVEMNFRKRNDKIVDEVFKHAKIYGKRSESHKNIVIVKIKIFDNEIVTELSLEEIIKKSY